MLKKSKSAFIIVGFLSLFDAKVTTLRQAPERQRCRLFEFLPWLCELGLSLSGVQRGFWVEVGLRCGGHLVLVEAVYL
jgi:hypothetical protein